MDQNLLIIVISCSAIMYTFTNFYFNQSLNKNKNNDNNKIDDDHDEYNKMYKIIELASGLDKDPYDRKISPKVVRKFCKIAKKYTINLNTITDDEFDFIYKKYTEYLIKKHTYG